MNFFERQRRVQRLSGRLVLLFLLAVVGIVLTVDLVVLFVFGGFEGPVEDAIIMVLVTSVLVVTVIGLASLVRTLSLRGGGGSRVAEALGAKPVPEDTTDPRLQRLRNVVEEVAIASGVPVPDLYILDGEPAINAFAAGWSPSDAAVAVTSGTLEQLNRDELQGVIAHEFSHVVNGDMRLNIKLMGLLFGILILAIVGRIMLHIRGGQRNPLPLIGLAMLVLGFVGVLVGRIIKAAVSRQREYLADASAVQYTRQTEGLTGALKKIAGVPAGSNLRNSKTEDVSHMLFGSGKGFSGLFATHPPLPKRIAALDPSVTEEELELLRQRYSASPPSGMAEDEALGLAGGGGRTLPQPEQTVPASADRVADSVGAPEEDAYAQAGELLQQIPQELRERAHQPDTVVPLVFGLLLAEQHDIRVNQHAVLAQRHGQAVADAAWQEAHHLSTLHPMLRLPLAQVAFPALHHRPRQEQDTLTHTVHALIQADERLSVSEYCLSRLLYQELYESAHHSPPWKRKRYSLSASRRAAGALLATLAQAGHHEQAAAEAAFHAGVARMFPGQQFAYAPPPEGVQALEAVWPPLDGLNPADKQLLVQGLVDVVSHAGEVTVTELELLRTVCSVLHCPLPPVAQQPADVTG